ncbi:MAG: hypothetical protein V4544_00030 [Pseudomonadota bacterium]
MYKKLYYLGVVISCAVHATEYSNKRMREQPLDVISSLQCVDKENTYNPGIPKDLHQFEHSECVPLLRKETERSTSEDFSLTRTETLFDTQSESLTGVDLMSSGKVTESNNSFLWIDVSTDSAGVQLFPVVEVTSMFASPKPSESIVRYDPKLKDYLSGKTINSLGIFKVLKVLRSQPGMNVHEFNMILHAVFMRSIEICADAECKNYVEQGLNETLSYAILNNFALPIDVLQKAFNFGAERVDNNGISQLRNGSLAEFIFIKYHAKLSFESICSALKCAILTPEDYVSETLPLCIIHHYWDKFDSQYIQHVFPFIQKVSVASVVYDLAKKRNIQVDMMGLRLKKMPLGEDNLQAIKNNSYFFVWSMLNNLQNRLNSDVFDRLNQSFNAI